MTSYLKIAPALCINLLFIAWKKIADAHSFKRGTLCVLTVSEVSVHGRLAPREHHGGRVWCGIAGNITPAGKQTAEKKTREQGARD